MTSTTDPSETGSDVQREVREQDFWGHHIASVGEVLHDLKTGPRPNEALMLDAIRPRPGMRILDFACGAGITSLRLAECGAQVVGLDLSGPALEVGRRAAAEAGLEVEFRQGEPGDPRQGIAAEDFDAVVGRYALHHLDLSVYMPVLRGALRPGGSCSFLETMVTNPLLSFARKRIVGRLGVPRLGTEDEHPLTRADIRYFASLFSSVELRVADINFLGILDRQLLRYRNVRITKAMYAGDRQLSRWGALSFLSYHQVVVLRR